MDPITHPPVDLKLRLLELLREGVTVPKACAQTGISHSCVFDWAEHDRTFAERFSRAREIGWDVMAEQLVHIHETIDSPAAARLASENRRWLLARVKPQTYGDKLDLNVTQTVDVGVALSAGRERVSRLARDQPVTIEAQAIEVQEESGSQSTDSQSDPTQDPAFLALLE